ncbi:hypothetical protein [Embleya sp. NPDC005971]|uniref:hypothetical protein n=1 Tax=Embleya sp. NPDC005971 TaxID=3156724 RepID=UPI00340A2A3A
MVGIRRGRHAPNKASLGILGLVAALVLGVFVISPTVGSAASSASTSVQTRYSPLGAIASGPAGPATAKLTVAPYCCPSSAVVLTPQQVITDRDSQGMNLGLPSDNTSVSAVEVCYAVLSATVGRTYISQTRVTDMTLPNSALVSFEDNTDRTAVGPACYTMPAHITPTGAMTLRLSVVFGSTADRITIGMVKLTGQSE